MGALYLCPPYLRAWNNGDLQRNQSHQVFRGARQTDLLDRCRNPGDVPGERGQLPNVVGERPLDVPGGCGIADWRPRLWSEIPGCAALDQDAGGAALPAFGVGEADPYSRHCAIFCGTAEGRTLFARPHQGWADGRFSLADGTGAARSGHRLDLHSHRPYGHLPGRTTHPAWGGHCSCRRTPYASGLARTQALSTSTFNQLHAAGGRQSGLRVSGDSIQNRGGGGRNLGQQRPADPAHVPSRSPNRLHLRRVL